MALAGIIRLEASPYADRQRVRVRVEIAPGDSDPPPHLQLSLHDPRGREVAEMLVMGLSDSYVELTLHMPHPAAEDELLDYTARGRLFSGVGEQEEETLEAVERPFAPGKE